MNKEELIEKVKQLSDLTNDEKAELIAGLRKKKYGLVWENHPEDVEERLRTQLPVLVEDKSKQIASEAEEAPNHILIEGDNLEALTALTYTHEGKIDVIYIDPPYNTGNKDFVYNDSFVDSEDGYRHSKWLSFMEKRLHIAKKLLSERGVIFISIDDNEQSNLKLLCDEVFGENDRLVSIVINRASEVATAFTIQKHEYCLVYAKDISKISISGNSKYTFSRGTVGNENQTMPIITFPVGIKCINIADGIYPETRKILGSRENIENLDPIIVENGVLKEPIRLKARWRSSNDMRNYFANGCKITKAKINGYIEEITLDGDRFMPQIKKLTTEKLSSLYLENKRGSKDLADVGITGFDFPKSVDYIRTLLRLFSEESSIILDFFAGSGTTLHATMQLNKEDGGHRQCILVTNNENNICENVTYERNKRVIEGYTTPKGEHVEGLHNNRLRYYKTDFVSRDNSMEGMRKLMGASTDLLCIKHDLYQEQHTFGSLKLRPHIARYFADGKGQKMLIIYKVDAIAYFVREIAQMPEETQIMVYVFSTNNYAMDADFEDVADKVTLCALPAAIYNAYLKVLPKKKMPVEADKEQEVPTLFEGEEDEQ